MRILLIGSGGREHALAYALNKTVSKDNIFSVPGNPGIWNLATKIELNINDHKLIVEFCKNNQIDFVVVGPEQPLADGLADSLTSADIPVFGPSKAAARLESSKVYAKDFMIRNNIPTAAYKSFNKSETEKAIKFIDDLSIPVVIKADGLAAGKGVIIAQSKDEAIKSLKEMFSGLFNEAGANVVIEEFMEGEEASIFVVTDGKDYITLAPAQDHKRVGEGETGKNTGGMGAYAPAKLVNSNILSLVNSKIIEPVLKGMAKERNPFIGCLYIGLMIKNGEPRVVEFNCRFGDPETQAVLHIFDGDLAELLYSASIAKLDKSKVNNIINGFACCVVLASDGYPDEYKKGFEITGLENVNPEKAYIFQAGTTLFEGKLVNSGGRVLGVTGLGIDLNMAIDNAYKELSKIHFDGMFYRKDIGKKGI